jgi:hypothetical protein
MKKILAPAVKVTGSVKLSYVMKFKKKYSKFYLFLAGQTDRIYNTLQVKVSLISHVVHTYNPSE